MLIKLYEWLTTDHKLNRYYIGTVVDNKDPDKLKRIKVSINKLLTGSTSDLPWVYPKGSSFLGSSSAAGEVSIPEMGSRVLIEFANQDIYSPFYSSSLLSVSEIQDIFNEDYPNSYGFKDSIGNWLKINKTQQYIELMHCSGSFIKIQKDGTITLNSTKDIVLTAANDINATAGGKVNIKSSSSTSIDAGSTASVKSGSKTTIQSGGNFEVNSSGSILEVAAALHSSSGSGITHG